VTCKKRQVHTAPYHLLDSKAFKAGLEPLAYSGIGS